MIRSCKLNENALADTRVHVHNIDAFVFIKDAAHLYDRVIIDMPDPHDAAISKLYSVEFYAMINQKLRDNGYVVTQSSSPYFARRTFWGIGSTLEAAFAESDAYQISIPSFGVWGFHLAAKQPGAFSETPSLSVPTKFWNDDVYAAAGVFAEDIGPMEQRLVNSIFEPKLYQLYLEDMNGPAS